MPGWGLTVLLPQAIGVRRAREMSFTGNFLLADEALQFGLVNHVVPHDELMPFTRQLAADIIGNDQPGVRQIRRTYAEITAETEGWEIEARDSRAWRDANFSAERVEPAPRRDPGPRPPAVVRRRRSGGRTPRRPRSRSTRAALAQRRPATASAMSRARISAPFSFRWKPSSARTSLPWPSRGR